MIYAFWHLIGPAQHDSLVLQQEERFTVAWDESARTKYSFIGDRYASDPSEEEFALALMATTSATGQT